MSFTQDFSQGEIEEKPSYELIKPGKYMMQLSSCEHKRNNKNNGSWVNYKIEILDGSFSGRVFFTRINADHENETAARIGAEQLTVLSKLCKLQTFNDPEDALNKPFNGIVMIEEGSNGYEPQNKLDFNALKKEIRSGAVAPVAKPERVESAPSDTPRAAPSQDLGEGVMPWAKT